MRKAVIAALIGNSVFGFSFMFSKILLDQIQPFTLLALRFCIAFICMNLLVLAGKARIRLKGKNISGLLCLGIAQPILYFVFENYGIAMTNSVIAGAMIALVPIVGTVLARIFLGEYFGWLQMAGIFLSFVGVVLITISGQQTGSASATGILLLAGAVLSAGIFNLISRKTAEEFTAFERTYVMFGMGSVFFLAVVSGLDTTRFIYESSLILRDMRLLSAFIYLGIVSSVIAFFLLNYAVNDLPVAKATSFTNLTAVVSMAAGVIFLGERVSILHIASSVMVLASVYAVNKLQIKPEK